MSLGLEQDNSSFSSLLFQLKEGVKNMKSLEVYSNENSGCVVETDGELIEIRQHTEYEDTQTIVLYKDELEKLWDLVQQYSEE